MGGRQRGKILACFLFTSLTPPQIVLLMLIVCSKPRLISDHLPMAFALCSNIYVLNGLVVLLLDAADHGRFRTCGTGAEKDGSFVLRD